MGCDGGTIPKRDELVRLKKKKEQKDKESVMKHKWGDCSVSEKPLKRPIVSCQLGRLYNKEEILLTLLNKTQANYNVEHVKGLKDVVELRLTDNPDYEKFPSGSATRAPWSCPVTGLEMTGRHGFFYPWTCGCVTSSRVLKEISTGDCIQCGKPYTSADVIIINPDEDELKKAEENMIERNLKRKQEKKSKKRPIDEAESKGEKRVKTKAEKPAVNKGASISGIANSILRGTEFDSVRDRSASIAKNPEHSEVYKSIFDTHASANKKLKSNWVTCNPRYY